MNTITENHTDKIKNFYMVLNQEENAKKNSFIKMPPAERYAHSFEPELLDAHVIALANLLS